jgi:type IV pilus assembly protein PilA
MIIYKDPILLVSPKTQIVLMKISLIDLNDGIGYGTVMSNRRFSLGSGRRSIRGGFTLVELLVVIAIIAILAAVALPAITGAIKKAQENGALQSAHSLSVGLFQFANDNGYVFPGTTGSVTVTSSTQAFNFLVPSYISNTGVFYIPLATKSKCITATLTSANVCWDFTTESNAGVNIGLNSNDPDTVPLVYTTGTTVTYGMAGQIGACTAVNNPTTGSANPFATDGVAVGFKDGSSAFEPFTPSNVAASSGIGWNISSPSFNPVVSYAQLTP